MTFEFNSRDTYKTFRANWKAAYLTNIKKSRDLKIQFKDIARELSAFELTLNRDRWGYLILNSDWAKIWTRLEEVRSQRRDVKQEAIDMLKELNSAKQEAQRQWLAQHNS